MTAVEKLELRLLGIVSFDSEELRAKYKERIAKAKELEKQQIIDAIAESNKLNNRNVSLNPKQYYNETFKNK